jgi:hypothetical protein
VPQGNSLSSYFKQAKMSFFFLYKIRGQEGRTVLSCLEWLVWVGGGGAWEMVKKSEYIANNEYTCV